MKVINDVEYAQLALRAVFVAILMRNCNPHILCLFEPTAGGNNQKREQLQSISDQGFIILAQS